MSLSHQLAPGVVVHTHACGEQDIFVNAYLVETATCVVAVDATLTMSSSRALRDRLEKLQKPLAAVLVTHPHPDHVAGLSNLATGDDVPIYATAGVRELMRELEGPKREQWGPVYGDEWVPRWRHPNRTVASGQTLSVDSVDYTVHDLGRGGDSDANAIWIAKPQGQAAQSAVFLSDLVFHGVHSYIADGGVLAWLANLQRCRTLCAGVDLGLPGHGASDRPGVLLDRQRDYLLRYCERLQEIADEGPLNDDRRARLTAALRADVPGAGLEFLVGMSADAVLRELRQGSG